MAMSIQMYVRRAIVPCVARKFILNVAFWVCNCILVRAKNASVWMQQFRYSKGGLALYKSSWNDENVDCLTSKQEKRVTSNLLGTFQGEIEVKLKVLFSI